MTTLPLYSFGSWKPFGNNNMDSGIIALLGCFELLYHTLQVRLLVILKEGHPFRHRIPTSACPIKLTRTV